MSKRICLGTVQFGKAYGITNDGGIVRNEEIREIFDTASKEGISYLDTAQSYGDAEAKIGKLWPSDGARPEILSKQMPGSSEELWETNFQNTLTNVNGKYLECFFIHNTLDLMKQDSGRQIRWLKNLKERGLIKKIGISIYEKREIEMIDMDIIEAIQIPLSIYDQRLMQDGTIKKLKEAGKVLYARSVLLQGLIATSHTKWPKFLSDEFKRHHEYNENKAMEESTTMIGEAIRYIKNISEIEAMIIGVQTKNQLQEVIQNWNQTHKISNNYERYKWDNETELDPRAWPA